MTALPEITAHPETIDDEGMTTTTDGRTGTETVLIESGTTMIEVAPVGQEAGVALPAIATCIADRTAAIGNSDAGHDARTATAPTATAPTANAPTATQCQSLEPCVGMEDPAQLIVVV